MLYKKVFALEKKKMKSGPILVWAPSLVTLVTPAAWPSTCSFYSRVWSIWSRSLTAARLFLVVGSPEKTSQQFFLPLTLFFFLVFIACSRDFGAQQSNHTPSYDFVGSQKWNRLYNYYRLLLLMYIMQSKLIDSQWLGARANAIDFRH